MLHTGRTFCFPQLCDTLVCVCVCVCLCVCGITPQLCDTLGKELVEKEMSQALVKLLKDSEAEVPGCLSHALF